LTVYPGGTWKSAGASPLARMLAQPAIAPYPALERKKRVLIKPNCVAVKFQLGSTHADALRGILDYLAPRFKGPVVITESSRDDTSEAYENFQYNRVVSEYRSQKVSLVDLN
jgi:uncharacterized protein (DUF362 family)